MMHSIGGVAVAPVVVLSLLATLPAAAPAVGAASGEELPEVGMAVGQRFPDLTLPDLDGKPRSISEFRGRKLILHVFASW